MRYKCSPYVIAVLDFKKLYIPGKNKYLLHKLKTNMKSHFLFAVCFTLISCKLTELWNDEDDSPSVILFCIFNVIYYIQLRYYLNSTKILRKYHVTVLKYPSKHTIKCYFGPNIQMYNKLELKNETKVVYNFM